ncbi:MAG: hypothetical protein IID40_03945 [Planctomycetes bacterium]|nr:hypothetical protein [Planctomycetota bacterium]
MATSTLKLTPEVETAALAQDWLDEAQSESDGEDFTRRHRDPRTPWNVDLEIHVLQPRGRSKTFYAKSFDISEGGLGLVCRTRIPPYSKVIVCRGGEMIGVSTVTQSCTQTLTGYLIGTQFRPDPETKVRTLKAKAG